MGAAFLARLFGALRRSKQAATPVPAIDRFPACLAVVLRHEGGYVDHPRDPGGATNMGITHKTLAAWRGKPVTKDDVRALGRAEASAIYRAWYWDNLSCSALPAGLDLVVFDFGVNAGIARSASLLQALVDVPRDGQFGPVTLRAVQGRDVAELVRAFSAARLRYYQRLPHWPTFRTGWTRRTREVEAEAQAMAGQ